MIFSCLKEDGELTCSKDIKANYFPTFQELNEILIGLADCVAFHGSATAEVGLIFLKFTIAKLQDNIKNKNKNVGYLHCSPGYHLINYLV